MKEFQFKQTYEEFKIADKVYKIDFSDKALKRYQVELFEYQKEAKRIQSIDETKLNDEEQKKTFEEAIEAIKTFIDCILGEGSFDELYEASGESAENMTHLVQYLGEIIGERLEPMKQAAKKQKYNKKKGK